MCQVVRFKCSLTNPPFNFTIHIARPDKPALLVCLLAVSFFSTSHTRFPLSRRDLSSRSPSAEASSSSRLNSHIHILLPDHQHSNAGPATTPSSDLTTPFVDISHQTLLKVPPKEAVTAEDNVKLLVAAIGSLTGKVSCRIRIFHASHY